MEIKACENNRLNNALTPHSANIAKTDFATQSIVLEQTFTAQKPNAVWHTDITYIQTAEGWLYLAGVKDQFLRPALIQAERPPIPGEKRRDFPRCIGK